LASAKNIWRIALEARGGGSQKWVGEGNLNSYLSSGCLAVSVIVFEQKGMKGWNEYNLYSFDAYLYI
jgi:hypothetical protein